MVRAILCGAFAIAVFGLSTAAVIAAEPNSPFSLPAGENTSFETGIVEGQASQPDQVERRASSSNDPLTPPPFVYATSKFFAAVSVIDPVSHAVVDSLRVGRFPEGLAVTPSGDKVFVSNKASDTVSVIDTASHDVIATIRVGDSPKRIAVSPSGESAYVVNESDGTVSVIDTARNRVTATIPVGDRSQGGSARTSGVAVHPDGSKVYVADSRNEQVAVIDARRNSVLERIALDGDPKGLALSPDGRRLYVTDTSDAISEHRISVIDTTNGTVIATIPVGETPEGVAVHPNGTRVFVATFDGLFVIDAARNRVIAAIPPGGAATALPPAGGRDVAVHPDGSRIYVASINGLTVLDAVDHRVITTKRIGSSDAVAVGPLILPQASIAASVLPSSRSLTLGKTASVFASLVNASENPAHGCRISPPPGLAADFWFQTTDHATNALTGSRNASALLPPGGTQTFAMSLTPRAALPPREIVFDFSCDNASAAATVSGVNTLTLSAAPTPVADIIALAATPEDPGIVHVPRAGAGLFAVASFNLGATSSITARARLRPPSLPVTLSICQSNSATGACLSPLSAGVTTTVAPGASPTFVVIVSGNRQAVPLAPGANRIVVEFLDGGGVLRGGTSVALRVF